jgi:hypothetical protein
MRAGSEHVEFIDQNVNFGVCNLRLKEARYFPAILAGLRADLTRKPMMIGRVNGYKVQRSRRR